MAVTDLPAGPYPLDPRRTGERGNNVELIRSLWPAHKGQWLYCLSMSAPTGYYDTAREALHAARVAAGLGDVGEKACDQFQEKYTAERVGLWPLCSHCQWARDRHAA